MNGNFRVKELGFVYRNRGAFMELVDNESYDWTRDDHRDLLRGMLMTACDLAAITKPWDVERRIAELVASEFFEQGDLEKQTLNIVPIVCQVPLCPVKIIIIFI